MPSLSGITLPSIPFLTPTPEPPPQLSLEALDTMIRYLAIYTQHAVSLDSRKTTAKLKRDAEQLIMGMSIHGTQSLHEYLVVLKRTPDVAIAFDSRMLARYTRGDAEAMGVLVEGLGEVLVALAGVLEGGFTVPGRWVDEED